MTQITAHWEGKSVNVISHGAYWSIECQRNGKIRLEKQETESANKLHTAHEHLAWLCEADEGTVYCHSSEKVIHKCKRKNPVVLAMVNF